ncbi:MAG: hypothetical protein HC902_09655 [Calothrix sp. SM1_5_4]|nr:hypothetical protein [Calothrix sp. SM1_5_4]
MNTTAARLEPEFARDEGLIAPRFENLLQMITFFMQWEPEAVDELIRHNFMSLPSSIRSAHDLVRYLTPERVGLAFPPHTYPDRLAPLRTRLHGYLLTTSDGEDFMRSAFEHYLTYLAVTSETEFKIISGDWERVSAHLPKVLAARVLPFWGWPGFSLRTPVAVAPTEYRVLRADANGAPLRANRGLGFPLPWDSRRLDPDVMP